MTTVISEKDVSVLLSIYRPIFLGKSVAPASVISRSSGVMDCSFVALDEGVVVSVKAHQDEILAGYTININETDGWIAISGQRCAVKDARFPESLRSGNLRYHISPIFDGISPSDGKLNVEVLGSGIASEEGIIRTDRERLVTKSRGEIEALIVERADHKMRYSTRHFVENYDIVEWVKETGMTSS